MQNTIIEDALIFLAVAVVVSPLCHRLRISPVLGYLVAGSVVGPVGWGLIADHDGTHALAELGIVFLLFMIGLELSWDRLKVMRRFIFGLGTAQVIGTGAVLAAILAAVGLSGPGVMIAGLALAFSSTAFVLQILAENGQLASRTGRVAVAVLILQDLAVVPLLVLVPLVGADAGLGAVLWGMTLAIAKAVAAMVVIFILGRLAARPLFQAVAATRSPEVFVATVLFAVIGTAQVTEHAGLSQSLGAFLAGVMLASTEFRHQIEADIMPVRGLLMGLFFLTVGMTVDPAKLIADLPTVLSGTLLLVGAKTLVLTALARGLRFPLATSLHLGLLLSQGGEFAFVVLARAQDQALLGQELTERLTGIIALSMALTPILAALGDWVARRAAPPPAAVAPTEQDTVEMAGHAIIAGCGRAGQIIATLLKAQGFAYVAIDRDPRLVETLRARGEPVFFGDIRKLEVLKAVGADRARAVVLTIDAGSGREKLVPRLRVLFPELRILVRARDRRQAHGLAALGATAVVPEILEGSLQLAAQTLRQLGLGQAEVTDIIEACRQGDYAGLALTEEAGEASL